jgi:polysaccharide export outer membrane protein
MSRRLAFLASLLLVLGGCAQDELGLLVDTIYPAQPAGATPEPVSVASSDGWGTSVQRADVPVKPAAAAARPIPVGESGSWGTSVERADVIRQAPVKPAEAAPKPAATDIGGWGIDLKNADVIYDAPAKPVEAAPKPTPVADFGSWGASVYAPPPAVACCQAAPVPWGAAMVVPAGPPPVLQTPYILDTGDRLRVFVYGQPSLSRLYTVDQIGNISVPLIRSVRARGRTTVDLEHAIASRLARDFVRDPQVTVDVAQNRPFFILGEVRLPGQYPYVSGMSVETAVAIAGGYTERASERRFRITRRLGEMIDQIEAPGDYPLQPGDTVYVLERFL